MSTASDPNEIAAAWYTRYRSMRVKLALLVGALALIFVGMVWLKDKLLTIDPGKGTPIGYAVRTDHHIAVLIQTLEAYVPSPNRDHSKNTYTISLFIVPLDGGKPKLVPIKEGLSPNNYSLAKVIGSDGRALWYDVSGTGAVDLKTFKLLRPAELRDPPDPKRTSALPFGPKVEHHLAAGLFTSPTSWLGLHSTDEAARDLKPGFSLKRVRDAESAKQQRLFHRCVLSADSNARGHPIVSMEPLGDATYFNAAFLRMHDAAEPIRLTDPLGALMIFTSEPGLKGTTVMACVDMNGSVLWRTDTGIDRFALQQILPGQESTAFLGTRPREEGKVPEPLLVIVDHATGEAHTEALWR
ncbi:MAG: hypothetical protein IPM46_10735 [Flavobacteriales bacterium]|nr:hypothetical protein [Flavobacteriales bacterium]